MPKRRALKPAKPISDEAFLRGAQASTTRAANVAIKRARAEAVAAEDRARQRGQGAAKPSDEASAASCRSDP